MNPPPDRRRSDRARPVDPAELQASLSAAASALEHAEAEFLGPLLVPEPPAPDNQLDYGEVNRLLVIFQELARRQMESLRLYEPLPHVQPFHADLRPERLLRGSNRAGKTLAATVECARAVSGQDPFDKYTRRDGRAFYVAKDGRACGQVLWRKLGRFGAFRIIRDLQTGQWRAFRPWQDHGRERESAPSPPLIPPRLIAEVSWENKKEMIPSVVRLRNGWELTFFSSLGEPPNGVDIDLGAFDEEIVNGAWYPEISARLLDREGRFWWAATPQYATEQLYDLHQRAEDPENTAVGEHILLLEDNPHISDKAKQDFAAKLTPEERRVRIGGEFAMTGFKVYPEFSKDLHLVYEPAQVPAEWTRYLAVDPGRQRCAVLFAAVPPDESMVLFYRELYIKNCDAVLFGQEMDRVTKGEAFEAFLIDHQAGRVHDMGSGANIELQYSQQLRKYGIHSRLTASGFEWGSPDVKAGINAVRDGLRLQDDGKPRFRVLADACPNLVHEFERYSYKSSTGPAKLPTDEPVKRNDHLMDGARYLAGYGLKYVKRAAKAGKANYAVEAMREKAKKKREKGGGGVRGIMLGPRSR